MCTLSYYHRNDGPIITANRDESPARNATGLSDYLSEKGNRYFITREPLHGGTNLVIGYRTRVSVLLNGAFGPHEFGKKYRMSRGLIVLESLEYPDLFDFSENFDFAGIEPFTMVNFGDEIQEIRWDGNHISRKGYPKNEHHIWASAQLYAPGAIEKRRQWYADLTSSAQILETQNLFDFHQYGGDGDPQNDMVMNRSDLVRTISVSQVATISGERKIKHLNVLTNEITEKP